MDKTKNYSGACLDLLGYDKFGTEAVKEPYKMFLELEMQYNATEWLPYEELQTLESKKNVYKFLCLEDRVNGLGSKLYIPADMTTGEYGKNIPVFYYAFRNQLSYFRDVKNKRSMDVGSALGLTVWKGLLNGFNVTAVDLAYKKDLPLEFLKTYVKTRAPEQFKNNLQILADDFLVVPNKYPELQGSYDLVNVQNVFHFYSPRSNDQMVKAIYSMLRDGGRAVITTEALEAARSSCADQTCSERLDEMKQEYQAPYIFKFKEKLGDGYIEYSMLKRYTEDDYSFSQNGNSVSSAKTYYDQESLSSLFQENNFNVIDYSVYSFGVDSSVLHSMSLVVEKIGEIANDL